MNQRKRTGQALIDAYVQLLNENSSRNITVSMLCRKAGYSRAAFYKNYSGMDDFVRHILDDEVEEYIANYNMPPEDEYLSVRSMIPLYEGIYRKKELYRALFDNANFDTLEAIDYYCDRVNNYALKHYKLSFPEGDADGIDLDFWYYCKQQEQKAAIRYWIRTDFAWSPEKIAEQTFLINSQRPVKIEWKK